MPCFFMGQAQKIKRPGPAPIDPLPSAALLRIKNAGQREAARQAHQGTKL